jgi:hypothetical protein
LSLTSRASEDIPEKFSGQKCANVLGKGDKGWFRTPATRLGARGPIRAHRHFRARSHAKPSTSGFNPLPDPLVIPAAFARPGRRICITIALIEAATRAHLWPERFEGMINGVFDPQDQVAARVAVAWSSSIGRFN